MAQLGRIETLEVVKITDFGPFLDGGELGEILLPRTFLSSPLAEGDHVEVFIYHDSENRLTATPHLPPGQVGDFVYLKVKAANEVGAFLDWGLPRDLFVPFREQKEKMREGKSYLVYIYYDRASNRIVASSRIERFLEKEGCPYAVGRAVNLIIAYPHERGYKAIIDNTYLGMIYANEVFRKLTVGERCLGYIKAVREDGKVDLSLQKAGYEQIQELEDIILRRLKEMKGELHLSDNSEPDAIYRAFGVSKKAFKKAIGVLYKKRLIVIEEEKIRLV